MTPPMGVDRKGEGEDIRGFVSPLVDRKGKGKDMRFSHLASEGKQASEANAPRSETKIRGLEKSSRRDEIVLAGR